MVIERGGGGGEQCSTISYKIIQGRVVALVPKQTFGVIFHEYLYISSQYMCYVK